MKRGDLWRRAVESEPRRSREARRRILVACALFAAALVAAPEISLAGTDPYAPKWNPWVEFGGFGADKGDGRGLIEFWSPLMQSQNALFFFDGRFQFIEDNAQEGNAQFGLRKMTPSGWNLGAWISGDVRETSADNTFWQVAGGLEALSVRWDLRLNGYLPVTDPQTSPSLAEVVLKRNNIFMIGGEEVALYGVDGEIGYMLFGSPETKQGTRHEFRVYGGGFWFDDSDAIQEVAGPSARIEWRIDDLIPDWGGSRLTFDAGYSHDEVRDDIWQVGARLRIPLGGIKTYALLSPQARRMQERIERDDDIITVQSGPEKVFDTLTGVRFDRVAYVNPSITEVSQQAGDNSLLILNGAVSGPQQLQGNQTLQGGGSTIQVTGVKSGVTANFTAPGATAHLVDPGNNHNLMLLGSNTHIAGLNIQGEPFSSLDGIFGESNLNTIVIEQTSIANTGLNGIAFEVNNSNVLIRDTTVTNAGRFGIIIGNDNDNVAIIDTTILGSNDAAIVFVNDNDNVTIANTRIDDALTGILVQDRNDITIQNVTLNAIREEGILLDDFSDVTIQNVTLNAIGQEGIFFSAFNNVTIQNVRFGIVVGDAVSFGSDNNVIVRSLDMRNVLGAGMRFSDRNDVDISDLGMVVVSQDGIVFGNLNNVTIRNATLDTIGSDGIAFANENDVIIQNAAFTSIGNDVVNVGGSENSVLLQNSIFAGVIGSDIVDVQPADNTINGDGNVTLPGTLLGGVVCRGRDNFTGTFFVDGVAYTGSVVGNCVP